MSKTERQIPMPTTLADAHALIEQLACTVDSQSNTIDELRRNTQDLELTIVELLQRAFRNRSERYIDNPDQLRLDFQDSDDGADAAEGD